MTYSKCAERKSKMSFKDEGGVKIFLDKQKVRGFDSSRNTLRTSFLKGDIY
jgi:hypothetical protein